MGGAVPLTQHQSEVSPPSGARAAGRKKKDQKSAEETKPTAEQHDWLAFTEFVGISEWQEVLGLIARDVVVFHSTRFSAEAKEGGSRCCSGIEEARR